MCTEADEVECLASVEVEAFQGTWEESVNGYQISVYVQTTYDNQESGT